MRPFLLAAFGLQIVFGTSCMMQTASAQDLPPETMMTRDARESAHPHAGCAQEQQDQQRQSDAPGGDFPCLGHCLSQATNRAVSDAPVPVSGSPALVPAFAFCSLAPLTGFDLSSPAFPCALSPPPNSTIVLRQ